MSDLSTFASKNKDACLSPGASFAIFFTIEAAAISAAWLTWPSVEKFPPPWLCDRHALLIKLKGLSRLSPSEIPESNNCKTLRQISEAPERATLYKGAQYPTPVFLPLLALVNKFTYAF